MMTPSRWDCACARQLARPRWRHSSTISDWKEVPESPRIKRSFSQQEFSSPRKKKRKHNTQTREIRMFPAHNRRMGGQVAQKKKSEVVTRLLSPPFYFSHRQPMMNYTSKFFFFSETSTRVCVAEKIKIKPQKILLIEITAVMWRAHHRKDGVSHARAMASHKRGWA